MGLITKRQDRRVPQARVVTRDNVCHVHSQSIVVPVSDECSWTVALIGPANIRIRENVSSQILYLNDWRPAIYQAPYNASKLALIFGHRSLTLLAPLVLHMMSIVPPEWPFLFLGSSDSIIQLTSSKAISYQLQSGRLRVQPIPDQFIHTEREGFDRALTSLRFYDHVTPGVEWLFVFSADSMMCANSNLTLNDWLQYD